MAKEPKKVNCQLPGAEEVAQGKSVEEALAPQMGRPPMEYNAEWADLLCEATATSSRSLCHHVTEFGKKIPDFPRISTIYKWLRTHEDFAKNYARAKDDQADYLAEEMLDIADDDSFDIGVTEDGKPFVKGENIQRAKLRVDTRKWIAAKLKPKKYGDKVQQEISGPDGGAVQMEYNDIQRSARIAALLAEARKRADK